MKVHLRMLGCRLNQAEIDQMARQFQQQGHEIVAEPDLADQIIVNTCAVTQEATRSSRKLIRELNRANAAAEISVTGCYAQISPSDIAVLPGVAQIFDNQSKDTLVPQITGVPLEVYDHEPIVRDEHIPGAAERTRAFIKVQDGCDNACTFCITTVARGEGRSRLISDVVHEIQGLVDAGVKEVVLTGVHLGSYGSDFGDSDGLVHLVQAILQDTDVPRLRLSSLEPWDLSPQFFDLWQDARVCRHLHLPLQSGCDATLKRMRRNTTQAEFRDLVDAARMRIPGIGITTDVIVGFPGETDEEFAISRDFVEEMQFSGLHVFRYSKRPGTPAAKMRGHIANDVKKERSQQLLAHSQEMELRFANQFAGEKLAVLWEQVIGSSEEGFANVGYTDNYIRVQGTHPRVLSNMITNAEIGGFDPSAAYIHAQPVID